MLWVSHFFFHFSPSNRFTSFEYVHSLKTFYDGFGWICQCLELCKVFLLYIHQSDINSLSSLITPIYKLISSCLTLRCRRSLLGFFLLLVLLIFVVFFSLFLLLLSSLWGSTGQIFMLTVEIVSVGASEDGTTRLPLSKVDTDRWVLQVSSTNNAIRCLSSDNVGNVLNTLIVEIEVSKVWLACVYENA